MCHRKSVRTETEKGTNRNREICHKKDRNPKGKKQLGKKERKKGKNREMCDKE